MAEALPLFRVWGQRKMVVLALIGFSSGLPFLLTKGALQAWMRIEQVDLATIGFFSLAALPYSLKFLWAPVMDRYVPPFLGRRRGWLIVTQIALVIAIAAMSLQNPRLSLQWLAINAVIIAFFSASQDIVVDAYRTDVLAEREMGAGAALYVTGYRIAMIATGGWAFMLAGSIPWPTLYLLISLLMSMGILGVLIAPEPLLRGAPPQTFGEAVVLPFAEFFTRAGVVRGVLVLAFIVLYKLPDSFAGALATPFLLDITFTQSDIGAIQGVMGIAASIAGAIAGGTLVARIGINRSIWVFAALQVASNLGYFTLALVGKQYPLLVSAILVENFCAGLVAAGFIAFLMSLCNSRFSATQYALLSSLVAASRDLFVAPAGVIAQSTGWPNYFLLTLVVAIPGVLLLPMFVPWNRESSLLAASHTGDTVDAASRE